MKCLLEKVTADMIFCICASEMAMVMFVYTGDMIIFVNRSHGVYR